MTSQPSDVSRLERLYQDQAPIEPAPALDYTIRSQARRAVSRSTSRAPRIWGAGFAAAAVVVIAATVVLENQSLAPEWQTDDRALMDLTEPAPMPAMESAQPARRRSEIMPESSSLGITVIESIPPEPQLQAPPPPEISADALTEALEIDRHDAVHAASALNMNRLSASATQSAAAARAPAASLWQQFDRAIEQAEYEVAGQVLEQLRQLNPDDPRVVEAERRLEDNRPE
ncbi:MAG: hypothetical protein AAGH65_00790 [Pseudomonadota bacterium]